MLCTLVLDAQDGRTALMLAADLKSFDTIKLLIKRNAKIDHENKVE